MKRLCVMTTGLLAIATWVQGATFTVPLTSVTGYYSGGGGSRPFTINLGVELSSIQGAQIQWQGYVTGGQYYDGTPFGSDFLASLPSPSEGTLPRRTTGPTVGGATWPSPELFSATSSFSGFGTNKWDFLLDGVATGKVELEMMMSAPEFPVWQQATGNIISASMIIEATPLYQLGDANKNNEVNFGDYLVFATNFGQAGSWGDGDFNGDKFVDFSDYLLLSGSFGYTGSASAVPEPATLGLLMLGAFALRRRHG